MQQAAAPAGMSASMALPSSRGQVGLPANQLGQPSWELQLLLTGCQNIGMDAICLQLLHACLRAAAASMTGSLALPSSPVHTCLMQTVLQQHF